MSGGYFEGINDRLQLEIYGFANNPGNVFEDREISDLIWDVLYLIHYFDLYKCDDTCRDTYLKQKEAFKKKWFGGNRGLRIRQTIDTVLEEARRELYETYGLKSIFPEESEVNDDT